MIDLAKSLLADLLRQQGVKQIDHDDDAFERIKALPSAILLAGQEKLADRRRKVKKWKDPDSGQMIVRSQKYERTLPLNINLFHKDESSANAVMTGILKGLPKGISDAEDNWITIVPGAIDWTTAQTGRVLGILVVTFTGGIYTDRTIAPFSSAEIEVDTEGGIQGGE